MPETLAYFDNKDTFVSLLFLVTSSFLRLQVYIIDYGLAKKYRDLQTHKHIPYRYLHCLIM